MLLMKSTPDLDALRQFINVRKENQSAEDDDPAAAFSPPVNQSLILIGAAGRNTGKTTLATALIRRIAQDTPVAALKITGIERGRTGCPHGGSGCGACSLLRGEYDLSEESDTASGKDTALLLAAGARPVYWLRSYHDEIKRGFDEFQKMLPPQTVIVCESNSLREYIRPLLFAMIGGTSPKPSAARVAPLADITLETHWSAAEEKKFLALAEERLRERLSQ